MIVGGGAYAAHRLINHYTTQRKSAGSFFANGDFEYECASYIVSGNTCRRVTLEGPMVGEGVTASSQEKEMWQKLGARIKQEDAAWIRESLQKHCVNGGDYTLITAGPAGFNRFQELHVEVTGEGEARCYKATYTDELRPYSAGVHT